MLQCGYLHCSYVSEVPLCRLGDSAQLQAGHQSRTTRLEEKNMPQVIAAYCRPAQLQAGHQSRSKKRIAGYCCVLPPCPIAWQLIAI
jgi:hypothetical protein